MRLTPINRTLESEGVLEHYYGANLKIARANNTRYRRIFRELSKPYVNQIENNTLSSEVGEDLVVAAYAEAILVGWDNLVDTDTGKEVAYSKSMARELLGEDEDLFALVRKVSEDTSKYLKQDQAEILKK